jgi:hypothetical protein
MRRSRKMNLAPIQNSMEENEQVQVALLKGPMERGVVESIIEQYTSGEPKEEDVKSTTVLKKAN